MTGFLIGLFVGASFGVLVGGFLAGTKRHRPLHEEAVEYLNQVQSED